ncbi:uncharacterized protein LOC133839958 [Drosophila sulfurigaster albostrigata]|uniref:uncharacterized protein LOC133839958 n=1 Tax=Drosophila sulfurigaster albostrigata TaxID=89887 RepID=UPI002D21B07E|nr:uncharacterized protein LOC133839958 [Drosophila sulfurigaster albostrigata]
MHFSTSVLVIVFGISLALALALEFKRHYDTILLYGRAPCVFHTVLPLLQLPTVLLSRGSSHKDWEFSTELLLLCCGTNAEQEQNSRTSWKLQSARRLIYVETRLHPQRLCEDFFERELYNVALLDAECATSGSFYSCRSFQKPSYAQLQILDALPIYVEQCEKWQDTHDWLRGNTFVERVNATLQLRDDYEFGKITYYGDIEKLTQQNLLDVAATLGSTMTADNWEYISYPYIITSYCVMVPVPAALPYKSIYTVVVEPLVLGILVLLFFIFSLLLVYSQRLTWRPFSLASVLLNDRSLRGLLGQSFPWPEHATRHVKAICCLMCFSSIMTTTMYQAYLQSLFTHPPPEASIRSLQEVPYSRYKVAIERREATNLLKSRNLTINDTKSGYILDDWNEFVHMRDTFNASFIYPVTELRWKTYAEQQRLFARPAFYYSDDICLHRMVMLSFPMRRSLPYRERFEEHMLHMQDFGMLESWMDHSFFDMVALGLTPLKDFSEPVIDEDILYLRDLTWVWLFYATGHVLATVLFAVECYRGRERGTATPMT